MTDCTVKDVERLDATPSYPPSSKLVDVVEFPVLGAEYRHRNGSVYIVIGIAEHTENGEWLTIYSNIDKPNVLWARPVNVFLDGRFEQVT